MTEVQMKRKAAFIILVMVICIPLGIGAVVAPFIGLYKLLIFLGVNSGNVIRISMLSFFALCIMFIVITDLYDGYKLILYNIRRDNNKKSTGE